jgi:hypothetical protein
MKDKPVVFQCSMEKEEYIRVNKHSKGNVLIEMFSPSQVTMGENGQVVLNSLDTENLIYTLKQILEEK